jgi:Domain of unknown function (DUF4376)
LRDIYIQIDENNTVVGWGTSEFMEGNEVVQIEPDHPFLTTSPMTWKYIDGQFIKDEALELQKVQNNKIEELNVACNKAILTSFEYNGNVIPFGETDQANLNQQLTLLLLDPALDSVVWKTENNGIKQFTREQFIEACKAGESHKRNNISHYWQLKAYVEGLTSVEEVQAINFDFIVDTNVDTDVEPEVGVETEVI